MPLIFLFSLIFFFSLLEATVTSLNLVLLVIVLWSALKAAEEGFVVAFFAGLILDLLKGHPLGSSSLFFLTVSFLIYVYKNRFRADKVAFLWPVSLITVFLDHWLFKQVLIPWQILVNSVLIIFFLPFFKKIPKINQER